MTFEPPQRKTQQPVQVREQVDRVRDTAAGPDHSPTAFNYDRIWASYGNQQTAPASSAAAQPRLDLGTPGHAATESSAHKERGWIKPSTSASEVAPHVGAVFFRTKEHEIDAGDRTNFLELAKRYAAAARRGLGTPEGAAGLKGRIVGYADPRRSAKPDNDQLSQHRAESVATGLGWALAIETSLGIDRFAFERIGAGVAVGAPDGSTPLAEGNTLAPFRRADIYIEGRASDVVTSPSVAREDDRKVRPPDYSAEVHGHDRWKPLVEQGHKGIINGMAGQVAGHLDGLGGNFKTLYLDMGSVAMRKPPWWDGRAKDLPYQDGYRSSGRSAGRNAAKAREALMIGKALLLMRDHKEFAFYFERHADTFLPYLRERAKQPPDAERLEALAAPLEHLHFMMVENRALASEVLKLSEQ